LFVDVNVNLSKFKIEHGFLHSKVARRIFLLFIICALLPLSALAYFSFNQVTKHLYQQTYKQLHQASKATAMTIIERFYFLETDLKMIISNQQNRNSDVLVSVNLEFRERLKGRFKGIVLLADSNRILSSLGTIQSVPQLNDDELHHITTGKTIIFVRSNAGRFASIFIAIALDTSQPSQNLLLGEIHPGYIWGGEGFLSPGTELFVLNKSNDVLFSTIPNYIPLQGLRYTMRETPQLRRFTWTYKGNTYIASYWTIFLRPNYLANFTLVHSRSKADIFEPLQNFKQIFILIVILSFMVVVYLSLRQIRTSLTPVELLKNATKRIAVRDFKNHVEIKSNDEFEELGASFNSMVDSLKESQEQLEYKAFYDQLTNLSNRELFIKHLERIIKLHKRRGDYLFAVLFIDIDRFKIINDSLGHLSGNQLLMRVARRLEDCIRTNDIVSRFGGDEFAILLDDIKDISEARRIADRIQKDLSLPVKLDAQEVFITASIGIALSTSSYDRAEDILRDADTAMYRAKSRGRAKYEIFDTEMHAAAMKLLQLEADLRRAVERKDFLAHYQPIVSLIERRIVGAEALIRWQHPQRGLISPNEFIPLAEETGIITTIGEWILRTACTQNKMWHDAGYKHLRMHVNFSSRQFLQKNIIQLIKNVLKETGIAAQYLDIEITESIAMEEHSILVLSQLRAMGVRISIDDFGTGYSSFGFLKRLPLDRLKIDKSFVAGITKDSELEAIVTAIISMAHTLKINVVAEGIETEEQLAFLYLKKCDELQGYFFSRPVSGNDFEKLLIKEVHSIHRLS
jgi:diguanylate cyclase (GGDEF)-like protein